jgi:iron complex transport system permease protein
MNKKYMVFLFLAIAMLALLPFIGMINIDPGSIFREGSRGFIFWQLRVPRTIMGFVAGSSLALAGLIFQILFRNSLATPYTLGISSGASAGIVLGIKLHLSMTFLGLNGLYFCGFLGALLSIGIILAIARLAKSYSIYTLLMSGVALNFFFASMIVLTQYLFDFTQAISILRWLMGGIDLAGYRELTFLLPLYLLFVSLAFLLRKELVIASAGEDFAFSKGLNLKIFRLAMFILVSVLVGTLVSFVGPIGFVGLIVPHIARMVFKTDFRSVLIFSVIFGGILLSAADFIARNLIPPAEIPVGIITSMMGAPFFLFVLISSLKKNQ